MNLVLEMYRAAFVSLLALPILGCLVVLLYAATQQRR